VLLNGVNGSDVSTSRGITSLYRYRNMSRLDDRGGRSEHAARPGETLLIRARGSTRSAPPVARPLTGTNDTRSSRRSTFHDHARIIQDRGGTLGLDTDHPLA